MTLKIYSLYFRIKIIQLHKENLADDGNFLNQIDISLSIVTLICFNIPIQKQKYFLERDFNQESLD